MSFSSWIASLRLEEAKKMMSEHPDAKLKDIAYNVGFSRKVKMTEEEIKAKKFAMASKKENAEEEAKEEALRQTCHKA